MDPIIVGDRVQNVHNEKILQVTYVEEKVPVSETKVSNFYTLNDGSRWSEFSLLRHWFPLQRGGGKAGVKEIERTEQAESEQD